MSIVTFKSGDKTALTENFTRSEFACPCGCNSQMIEQELADKIQGIRDRLGKKIRITSGLPLCQPQRQQESRRQQAEPSPVRHRCRLED